MRKIFILVILMSIMMLITLVPGYPWTEYKNIRYIDLDGDLTNEIVIEANHDAGSGHYIEDNARCEICRY